MATGGRLRIRGLGEEVRRRRDEVENAAQVYMERLYEREGVSEDPYEASLVHYTSLDALVNMLRTKGGGLRLFGATTMTDPQEGGSSETDRTIKTAIEHLDSDSWCAKRYQAPKICCFVGGKDDMRLEDKLLFWRLYGRDGRGVSIKIAPHKAKEWLESKVVERVNYRRVANSSMETREFDQFLEKINLVQGDAVESLEQDGEIEWSEIFPFCDMLMKQRFLHRNHEFEMEQEFRAVRWQAEMSVEEKRRKEGEQVHGNEIRTYWEVEELACRKWLTSRTHITLGANIKDIDQVEKKLKEMIRREYGKDTEAGVQVKKSMVRFAPR